MIERVRTAGGRVVGSAAFGLALAAYLLALSVGGDDGYVREHAPLGIVMLGIVYGSVTALSAMGLILIYRANRFINFAHGALGSMIGVLAIALVSTRGLSYWIALPLAVAAGAGAGAVIEFGVIRRFSNASRLVLTVASIGLAQLLGGVEFLGAKGLGFVTLAGGFDAPIDVSLTVDVYTFRGDELVIVMIVPFVIAALAWFLLRTDAGTAIRAAAENRDRALLLGIRVKRLSTMVWMIAGALAALTYMLQAPFTGVQPGVATNGPTVLLPVLAAAIVARMESLPIAVGAGIGLGIMNQVVQWNTLGNPSFVYVAYLAVIVLALLAQRGRLSRAADAADSSWAMSGLVRPVPTELRRLPEVRTVRALLLGVALAAAVLVPRAWTPSDQLLAGFAIVWCIVGVSLVVLTGWGGHISLGQFGIAGLAAMAAGNLVARANLDFFLVVLAAAVVGALAALAVGLPALRIRGLFLAVTTLALALALDQYVLNQNNFPDLLPGNVDRPLVWERFDLESPYPMYLTTLTFLVLAVGAVHSVRRTRSGRVLIATRDNERAAAATGVPTSVAKLSAFVLAGTLAGVAGALDVLLLHGLSPGAFSPVDSITVFSYAVIGGLGSITGALLGILVFKYLETLVWLGDIRLALNGAALLVVLYFLPGGLGQLVFGLRDRLLGVVADRRGLTVSAVTAAARPLEAGSDPAPEDAEKPAEVGV